MSNGPHMYTNMCMCISTRTISPNMYICVCVRVYIYMCLCVCVCESESVCVDKHYAMSYQTRTPLMFTVYFSCSHHIGLGCIRDKSYSKPRDYSCICEFVLLFFMMCFCNVLLITLRFIIYNNKLVS